MREVKHQDLIAERKKSAAHRQEIEELRAKVAKLASINEVLLDENCVLKAKISDRKVVDLPLGGRMDSTSHGAQLHPFDQPIPSLITDDFTRPERQTAATREAE